MIDIADPQFPDPMIHIFSIVLLDDLEKEEDVDDKIWVVGGFRMVFIFVVIFEVLIEVMFEVVATAADFENIVFDVAAEGIILVASIREIGKIAIIVVIRISDGPNCKRNGNNNNGIRSK